MEIAKKKLDLHLGICLILVTFNYCRKVLEKDTFA